MINVAAVKSIFFTLAKILIAAWVKRVEEERFQKSHTERNRTEWERYILAKNLNEFIVSFLLSGMIHKQTLKRRTQILKRRKAATMTWNQNKEERNQVQGKLLWRKKNKRKMMIMVQYHWIFQLLSIWPSPHCTSLLYAVSYLSCKGYCVVKIWNYGT